MGIAQEVVEHVVDRDALVSSGSLHHGAAVVDSGHAFAIVANSSGLKLTRKLTSQAGKYTPDAAASNALRTSSRSS
jgi:hypothetical protein